MSDRYNEYDNWAWLYNRTFGPSFAKDRLSLLQRVFLPAIPTNGRLLDLCCGTGQMARTLCDHGYQVTGLDGSQTMLELARVNAPAADFVLDDARTFATETRFDGVYCVTASLNHMETVDDLKRTFARVCASMHARSVFVFDINHHELMQSNWRGNLLFGQIEDDHAWVCSTFYDGAEQRGCFTVDIYRAPQGGTRPDPLRRMWYGMLRWSSLEQARLNVLRRFGRLQPDWQHTQLTYTVYGHRLQTIETALRESGFNDVSLQNEAGSNLVTDQDFAVFVCRR